MGDDIGSGLLSMSVCFDFCSTNVVQLSNRNPYLLLPFSMSSPINNPAYHGQQFTCVFFSLPMTRLKYAPNLSNFSTSIIMIIFQGLFSNLYGTIDNAETTNSDLLKMSSQASQRCLYTKKNHRVTLVIEKCFRHCCVAG